MIRVAVGLLAASVACAAPAIKAKPELYFPVEVGAVWTYETNVGYATNVSTETVTKVEQVGAAFRVTFERKVDGSVHAGGLIEVSAGGLTRPATGGPKAPKWVPLLKLPAKVGDAWTVEAVGPDGKVVQSTAHKVAKVDEEVQVPAGKFRAVRLEIESEIKGQIHRTTMWFAPGVGVVKSESRLGDHREIQILKSFSLGK